MTSVQSHFYKPVHHQTGIRSLFVLRCCVLIVLCALAVNAWAADRKPRIFKSPPAQTEIKPWQSTDRIIIKFAEGTEVRLRNGRFTSLRGADLQKARQALTRHGVLMNSIRPLFDRPEDELAAEKNRGENRSGKQLADLSLYYSVSLGPNVDAAAVCDALNELEVIESATPAPLEAPPPVDISPTTPDFTGLQGYRSLATGGIGIDEVQGIPGVDGAGMTFVDVEYGWILDHEDLELPASINIDDATIDSPYDPNHGTAVLGMLVAKDNGYGVTGMTPAAAAKISPITTVEHGTNAGRALSNAIAVLNPGDVILIETQAWVCGEGWAYGPLEWKQWIFDVVQTATSLGIIVIASAGNGYGNGADNLGVDLDAPACDGLFDPDVRDSGAIIVGAAEAFTRNKTGYSSYGSRVNLQGWGDQNVMTTGFGDHFDPNGDDRQLYTARFSGTSSAAPMVVAAAIAVQGARQAVGEPLLDSYQMRDLLVSTGLPQGTGGHIGPLPNIVAALAATSENIAVVASMDVDPWTSPNEIDPAAAEFLPVGIRTQSIASGDVQDFDAFQVDLTSLRFGSDGALNVAKPIANDFDGDDDMDLVIGFRIEDSGIQCDDTEVSLTGSTLSGDPFIAHDDIITINCETSECHP